MSRCSPTPEQLALLVELLPTVGSLRDICAILNLRLDTVRREAAPFLALMKLTGTHPQCGCGKDRFHPYGCVDNYAKAWRNPSHGPLTDFQQRTLARREKIVTMLLRGARFVDIDEAFGLPPKSSRKYLRFLSPEQMDERVRAIDRRGRINRRSPSARSARAKRTRTTGTFRPIFQEAYDAAA